MKVKVDDSAAVKGDVRAREPDQEKRTLRRRVIAEAAKVCKARSATHRGFGHYGPESEAEQCARAILALPATGAAMHDETTTFADGFGNATIGRLACKVDGATILPCFPLVSMLEKLGKRPGVALVERMSPGHSATRDGLVLLTPRGGHIPLDYCPLCGERIITEFRVGATVTP